ncbi:hypothetical protein AMTRI_Chr09g40330 [Amborella trichopoda]
MMNQELKEAVTNIHFRNEELKLRATEIIQKAAGEKGLKMRNCLVGLGVIPQLLTMLDTSCPPPFHLSSLQTLLQVSHGNSCGKAVIVEAGGLEKLSKLYLHSIDQTVHENISTLLFSISALNSCKSEIGSSSIFPLLISMLNSPCESVREASISSLLNLSTCFENLNIFLRHGAVKALFEFMQNPNGRGESKTTLSKFKDRGGRNSAESTARGERNTTVYKPFCSRERKTSECKSLYILSNIMVTVEGRKTLEKMVASEPWILGGFLRAEEEPKCQQKAAYILMVLVYYSRGLREVLRATKGLVPAVVEMGLLGTSSVLRERCLRIVKSLGRDKSWAL